MEGERVWRMILQCNNKFKSAEKSKAVQDYMKLGMNTEIPAEEYNSTFAELMAECETAQTVQAKWEQEKASRIRPQPKMCCVHKSDKW